VNDWRQLTPRQWLARLAHLPLDSRVAERLARYLALLGRWQGATNLVGDMDAESLLRDHVEESLAAAPWLPGSGRLLDVGSGNGFPALPLLATHGTLRGVLLEPRERRWAFLREAVREIGVDAEVRRERLEQHRGSGYQVLTVRAVESRVWKRAAARVLEPGGLVLWWAAGGGEPLAAAGLAPVLTSPLPNSRRGSLAVWRRCST
jgi:16S rRNA (guanine527-N7)-methyltransferase